MDSIEFLVGKVLSDIEDEQGERLVFTLDTGERYMLYHEQDCCEDVYLESAVGDFNDLIGTPILRASEDTNKGDLDGFDVTSYTWTFYNIATAKGHVTIRWYGSSNGYYSEAVSFGEYTEREHTCRFEDLQETGEAGGGCWQSNDIGSEHWYIQPYTQYRCSVCDRSYRRTGNTYSRG